MGNIDLFKVEELTRLFDTMCEQEKSKEFYAGFDAGIKAMKDRKKLVGDNDAFAGFLTGVRYYLDAYGKGYTLQEKMNDSTENL